MWTSAELPDFARSVFTAVSRKTPMKILVEIQLLYRKKTTYLRKKWGMRIFRKSIVT
jgi:hypothetical protein